MSRIPIPESKCSIRACGAEYVVPRVERNSIDGIDIAGDSVAD
jgi:hypothetical protein